MTLSRKFVLGATVLTFLAAAAVVTLFVGQETLAAVAGVLMALVIGVVVLDAATTLRRTERQLDKLLKTARVAARAPRVPPRAPSSPDPSPVAREADLLGTIRLLQAQYVGRLDRSQATLEAAADRLSASDGHER